LKHIILVQIEAECESHAHLIELTREMFVLNNLPSGKKPKLYYIIKPIQNSCKLPKIGD